MEQKNTNGSEMNAENVQYWKSHYESNSEKYDSLLKQVGKTIDGNEVSAEQLELIITNICKSLCLSKRDSLIDLCCGNGLITRQLLPFVNDVIGVDISSGLIDTAKKFSTNGNIKYINSDVLSLDIKLFQNVRKILIYEAIQHFSNDQLYKLLEKLSYLNKGSLVLLGSIPNKEKIMDYYDTEKKYMYYLCCENEGKPHMGKWWVMDEIEQMASFHGFQSTFIHQDKTMYTSYYRFDVILEKL